MKVIDPYPYLIPAGLPLQPLVFGCGHKGSFAQDRPISTVYAGCKKTNPLVKVLSRVIRNLVHGLGRKLIECLCAKNRPRKMPNNVKVSICIGDSSYRDSKITIWRWDIDDGQWEVGPVTLCLRIQYTGSNLSYPVVHSSTSCNCLCLSAF